jgi:hypothetical protein
MQRGSHRAAGSLALSSAKGSKRIIRVTCWGGPTRRKQRQLAGALAGPAIQSMQVGERPMATQDPLAPPAQGGNAKVGGAPSWACA